MKWLVTNDSELESIVLAAKKFREDEKIRLEEEKKNKRLKEIEQLEFENYKKLKEKFG